MKDAVHVLEPMIPSEGCGFFVRLRLRAQNRPLQSHSGIVLIIPAGGASEAGYIATFMIGQDLRVVVLLDTDRAGEDARDGLVKRWLTRYKDQHAEVLSLGPAAGVPNQDFAIEDPFPVDFYTCLVEEVYAKQLAAAGVPKLALTGTDMLCSGSNARLRTSR